MASYGNCPDGYCGGCPSCLRAQGYAPDEGQDPHECSECGEAIDLEDSLEALLDEDAILCADCTATTTREEQI